MYNPKTKPNVGKRIGATLIDQAILWTLLYLFFKEFGTPNPEGGYSVTGFLSFIPIIIWFCFIVLPEFYYSSTLGHKLLCLQVVSIEDINLKFSQVLKRRICDIIEVIGFFGLLAFILVKNTKFNQRLGDIWAKTIVIDKADPEQSNISFEFEEQTQLKSTNTW